VVPSERAAEVLERAEAAAAREVQVLELLARGAELGELRRALPPERW
jgi:regulator of RNase E activity RraA